MLSLEASFKLATSYEQESDQDQGTITTMKLIIAGASGFVGQEIVRQSLTRPEITSVIALSRKPVSSSDAGADTAKLRNVLVKSYEEYPQEVRKEFEGADACIWTISITPTKSKMYDFKDVVRVCQTSTIAGLKAMHESNAGKLLRFLYMSGSGAERDQTKTPGMMGQYMLMRGETENQVLAYAAQHKGEVEACVVKPGLITVPGLHMASMFAKAANWATTVPTVSREDIVAAMLNQVIKGFEKEPLENDDLNRMAQQLKE